jgi:hypothetical protein
MRFFVPPLGARLRLTAPWTFTLHRESRNASLFPLVGWSSENSYGRSDAPSVRIAYGNDTNYEHNPNPPAWAKERIGPITVTSLDFGEEVAPGTETAAYVRLVPGHRRYTLRTPIAGWPGSFNSERKCDACAKLGSRFNCPEEERPLPCHVDGTRIVVDAPVPPDAVRLVATGRLKGGQSTTLTLPEGTILTPDRYYIRQGANGFDSVTFRLQKPDGKQPKGAPKPPTGRFWVKLDDANRIEFEIPPEVQPWWHGVADRLRAGEQVVLDHDAPKVPKRVTVAPLALRTVADLDESRWLVYAEGARIGFWLVDQDAERRSLTHVPGEAFGTKDQFRGGLLQIEKVVGKVVAIGGKP